MNVGYTAQKMKFSIKDFFSKYVHYLVTFTDEILNGKLHFSCGDTVLNALLFFRCYSTARVTLRYLYGYQTYSGIFKTYSAIFRNPGIFRNILLQPYSDIF